MKPKGTVLIIGGSEDRGEEETTMEGKNNDYERFEILKELLPNSKQQKRIEIVTTASSVADEMKEMYKKAFKKIGFTNLGFIDIQDKHEARNPDYIKRVTASHAVFFSGGDQFKLSTILGGTEMVTAVKNKYREDKDFVVAGTSAGAMAISHLMIYEGGVNEAILKEDLKISAGLGILDCCIIDTHFIKRGRFGRLAHAVTMNPEALGIGLGEDTALVIKNGQESECRGSGMVVIIDGNYIEQTNITDSEDGNPIFVENLKVHLLVKGCKFTINDRKVAPYRVQDKKLKSERA